MKIDIPWFRRKNSKNDCYWHIIRQNLSSIYHKSFWMWIFSLQIHRFFGWEWRSPLEITSHWIIRTWILWQYLRNLKIKKKDDMKIFLMRGKRKSDWLEWTHKIQVKFVFISHIFWIVSAHINRIKVLFFDCFLNGEKGRRREKKGKLFFCSTTFIFRWVKFYVKPH